MGEDWRWVISGSAAVHDRWRALTAPQREESITFYTILGVSAIFVPEGLSAPRLLPSASWPAAGLQELLIFSRRSDMNLTYLNPPFYLGYSFLTYSEKKNYTLNQLTYIKNYIKQ